MLKDHNCGELRIKDIGKTVTLAGWVNRRRDMGGVIFVDLRDKDGITQVVVDASQSEDAFEVAESIRPEFVIQVKGTVSQRPKGQENPKMETGDVEVLIDGLYS